jgi:hypothetical protein
MAINTNPSSRRALLAAAAGGTVALVAESLARPLAARAEDPQYVVLGGENKSSSNTSIHIDDNEALSGNAALALINVGGDKFHAAPALAADSYFGSAINARSVEGYAIEAHSNDQAIVGISTGLIGVAGYGGEMGDTSPATNLTGVRGWSYAGNGVQGMSETGTGVHAESDTGTGVYGTSKRTGIHGTTKGSFDIDTNKDVVGVLGISQSVGGVGGNGIGVEGRSETGIGVHGAGQQGVHGASVSPGGTGVLAKSETGPALHAVALYPEQGARAIVAEGPVEFSSAGRGIIARGAMRATVVSPVPLNAAVSKILVTLLANPAGKMASSLSHVVIHQLRQAFTVVLTAPAAREVPFAYFVLG